MVLQPHPTSQPLDYEVPTPKNFFQRYLPTRRQILWIVMAFALIGEAAYSVNSIEVLLQQRKLAHFQLPENTVVFENDPKLVGQYGLSPNYVTTPAGVMRNERVNSDELLLDRQSYWFSGPLSRERDGPGFVFMHEMKSGDCRRIVKISSAQYGFPTGRYDCAELYIQPFEKATFSIPEMTKVTSQLEHAGLQSKYALRIYAGQIDPDNPAHATVGILNDGFLQVLHVWLRQSGRIDLDMEYE